MSANEGTAAVGVFAFDRANMLAGVAAGFQRFQAQANFMLPSDLDGPNPPPAGSPNLFYTMMDDVIWPIIGIPGPDRLEVYEFHVDFTNPPNSTFTLADTLLTAPFIYTVCGYFNFNCITQPGTAQRVDSVSEWPMWRLQYRNFGTHETLVGNFSVDVDGTDHAAIRWFELRRSGGSWSIFQEGTHSPDSDSRFMGSAAMDGDGNIALGYSVSSGSTFPSLRYATRVPGDPPGTLQPEASLVAGGGSQTGSNRWGDYSAMSVDPADDCTFWYTGEYQQATAPVNWRTRVGAFVLPSCSGVPPGSDLSVTKEDSLDPVQPGEQITYTVTVNNGGPDDATGVILTDPLDPNVAFDAGASDPACTESAGTVTCALGALNVDDTVSMTIVVTVDAGTEPGTVITNAVTVAGDQDDPVSSNNSAVEETTVGGASTCAGLPATIVGTPAGELILGTAGPDVIAAGGGDDTVIGGGGNDIICGDDGDDRISAGGGNDIVLGGLGSDLMLGGDGDDRLIGGDGDDTIACGSGSDIAHGGPGTDAAGGSCELQFAIP